MNVIIEVQTYYQIIRSLKDLNVKEILGEALLDLVFQNEYLQWVKVDGNIVYDINNAIDPHNL